MSAQLLRRTAAVTAAAGLVAAALPGVAGAATAASPGPGRPAVAAAPAEPAAPAAPDPALAGLFGAADPTYDGAYRQTLSLLALTAAGVRPPRASVRWLVRQQCPDGSFQAYRSDLSAPCATADPDAFTGTDTNSTALAAMALDATGRSEQARRAQRWLVRVQNPDGGWGYVAGSASDANSTGLVLAALRAVGRNPASVTRRGTSGADFLAGLRLGCAADPADRGALAFQSSPGSPLVANALASAQGLLGLAGTLPVAPRGLAASAPSIRCDGARETRRTPLPRAVAGYLARSLDASGGALPDPFGSDAPDWNATANAVLGLVAAGSGRGAVRVAMTRLGAAVPTFTREDDGSGRPAALATLVLAAEATGADPRSFGRNGSDLVADLLATRQR